VGARWASAKGMTSMLLCRRDDVPDGGARGFPEQKVFVVRRGARVDVWRDNCPHEQVPMAWRRDEYLNKSGTRIVCAAHGAQFEMDNGVCTLGPCLGQSLERVAHRMAGDGIVIQVTLTLE
jgi:nitrite reductase/ring-hydroxylating ferredoxin subunit